MVVYYMGFPGFETRYAWDTFYPNELFNIAAPPDYAKVGSIKKHPLYFVEKRGSLPVTDGQFVGWIIILEQFSISKSAFDFYMDLNSQLDADGKLFDPLYVQARNNLRCITDPSKIILGNFEISNKSETRYFVRYINENKGYEIRPIYNHYNIPYEGKDIPALPIWWEWQ